MKKNNCIWVLICVQWGSGADSYDFREMVRWVDTTTGEIHKPFLLLRGFINLFRLFDGVCEYGWGYAARDAMDADLKRGFINLRKLVVK